MIFYLSHSSKWDKLRGKTSQDVIEVIKKTLEDNQHSVIEPHTDRETAKIRKCSKRYLEKSNFVLIECSLPSQGSKEEVTKWAKNKPLVAILRDGLKLPEWLEKLKLFKIITYNSVKELTAKLTQEFGSS